jgi:phosphatidylglycerol:prolipoprotein diacylglycerol transferase
VHPILGEVSIDGVEIVVRAYSTFLVVAAVVAVALAARAAGRLGVGRRAAIAGLGLALVAGLVGARVLAVVLELPAYADDPAAALEVAPRGFALYGGLAGAALAMAVLARRWGVAIGSLADASIVAVAVGLALVRVGCFLNGCCAGIESDVPWAVSFPAGGSSWGQQLLGGSAAALFGHAHGVHPTQLYEAAAALAAAALAVGVRRRGPGLPGGTPALVFAVVFLAYRAFNQLLRPATPDATLSTPALVAAYVLAAFLAAGWLAVRARRGPTESRLGLSHSGASAG